MKRYTIGIVAMALAAVLFTGCGCRNTKPMNTQPSTLPPTTGATIMPTTEATTMPTTAATTEATTENTMLPDGMATEDTAVTEMPGDTVDGNGARSRMPAHNGK